MTLCYASVSGIIEQIVITEGHKFRYPGYEYDDIAQEIRSVCISAMLKYDPSRLSINNPSPYPLSFLRKCVRNHIYNLNRGIFVPNNPPCTRCPLWDKVHRKCSINEEGCDKIAKYRTNMAKRAAIKYPASLEYTTEDLNTNMDINSFILDESIRGVLPKNLLEDYKRMISGNAKLVSTSRKSKIRKIIREMLRDEQGKN